MLEGLLPSKVEVCLAAIILVEDDTVQDDFCWGLDISGQFSVRSAYEVEVDSSAFLEDRIWKNL